MTYTYHLVKTSIVRVNEWDQPEVIPKEFYCQVKKPRLIVYDERFVPIGSPFCKTCKKKLVEEIIENVDYTKFPNFDI